MAAAILALAVACSSQAQTASGVARRILVLHSYQQGEGWVQNVNDGIRSFFGANREYIWNLRYEYMNVLDTEPSEYPEIYQRRFRRSRFDLLLCVDDQALAFAVANRAGFFPGVPIVFAGVERFDPEMLAGERGITGVVGESDFAGTFAIMRRLHPQSRHVLILANQQVTSETAAYERLVRAANDTFPREVSIRYWQDPALAEVLDRAGSFAPDTVAFSAANFTDDTGRQLPLVSTMRQVSDALGLPIYSCSESVLGDGIVGGSVTGGFQQGAEAAGLAVRIMRGEDPDTIPVLRSGTARPMFDWQEIERFGISTRLLPRGSLYVNHPDTLYERFKTAIWAGAAVLAALAALLAISLAYIVAQNRLKRRIAHSEQRLAAALEATGSGIWEWDPVDNETYFDPRWFSMLGYAPGELPLTYETWVSLLHPEDRERAEQGIRRHVEEGTDFYLEFRMRAADGRWRWIGSSGTVAERDGAGRVTRMVGTHLDITERRAVQEAVQESARRYRFLYERSPALSLVVGTDGTIRDVNAAFASALGRPAAEIVGKPFAAFIAEQDRGRVSDYIAAELRGESAPQTEVNILARDGATRTLLLSGSAVMMREGASTEGLLAVGLDISERKLAEVRERDHEQQLIQADKMASLGVLVSGVAHEINNPTNFILLNGRICSKVWTDVMPVLREYHDAHGEFLVGGMPFQEAWPRIGKLMEGIHEGAQRIRKIVQSLRDFARRDPGDLDRELDLNAVADSAVTLVRHLLDTSTDRFALELDPEIPRVRGNYQQLEQVVINLLTNACHALPSRERGIRLASRYDAGGDRVVLEVADEGTGIPPELMVRVFDPFFTTKQDRGGTGLGLSISYNIVRNHCGELTLASVPGEGTVATVIMPTSCPRPTPAGAGQGGGGVADPAEATT